jgi:hypothetical protein
MGGFFYGKSMSVLRETNSSLKDPMLILKDPASPLNEGTFHQAKGMFPVEGTASILLMTKFPLEEGNFPE